jgi:soluble lytic murein transglycosylase
MRVTKAGPSKSVYERAGRWHGLALLALLAACGAWAAPAPAPDPATTVLDAREAFRKRDRNRLAALRAQANAEANPLAMWVE